MFGNALGLIETFGLVPAVEAADAAVKSAAVSIQDRRCVGAGLVTIVLTGDVSSVKAAVEAGAASARRLGEVRSTTVIARTGDGLETILVSPTPDTDPRNPTHSGEGDDPAEQVDPPEQKGQGSSEAAAQPDLTGIKKMKVSKLRHLARQVDGICLSRKDIKFARKKELIQAILAACGQDKEKS